MTVKITTLIRDMETQALRTWRKIELSEQVNLRYSEETITDDNLLTLALKHRDLLVHRYTQNREHQIGADWEWWIGSVQTGWLCLRIQAKRVKRSRYPELSHDGAADDEFQYDTLIRSCDPLRGEYPLHVFYNGWSKGTFAPDTYWAEPANWRACPDGDGPDQCHHVTPQHYGCAVASSINVKQVVESKTPADRAVTSHLSNALPWSYLLGAPDRNSQNSGSSLFPNGNRGRTTADGLDPDVWMAEAQTTLGVLQMGDEHMHHEHWAGVARNINPESRCFNLPDYVEAIRTRATADFRTTNSDDLPPTPLTIVLDKTPRKRQKPARRRQGT